MSTTTTPSPEMKSAWQAAKRYFCNSLGNPHGLIFLGSILIPIIRKSSDASAGLSGIPWVYGKRCTGKTEISKVAQYFYRSPASDNRETCPPTDIAVFRNLLSQPANLDQPLAFDEITSETLDFEFLSLLRSSAFRQEIPGLKGYPSQPLILTGEAAPYDAATASRFLFFKSGTQPWNHEMFPYDLLPSLYEINELLVKSSDFSDQTTALAKRYLISYKADLPSRIRMNISFAAAAFMTADQTLGEDSPQQNTADWMLDYLQQIPVDEFQPQEPQSEEPAAPYEPTPDIVAIRQTIERRVITRRFSQEEGEYLMEAIAQRINR